MRALRVFNQNCYLDILDNHFDESVYLLSLMDCTNISVLNFVTGIVLGGQRDSLEYTGIYRVIMVDLSCFTPFLVASS